MARKSSLHNVAQSMLDTRFDPNVATFVSPKNPTTRAIVRTESLHRYTVQLVCGDSRYTLAFSELTRALQIALDHIG